MSLLSGIRFVPKDKRPAVSLDLNADRAKDDKKEKKRKHDRKHSKKHKNSREHKSYEKQKHYESDSSSSIDMEEIARAEEDKERHEKRTRLEESFEYKQDEANPTSTAEVESATTRKIDPNHFRSLIDSLKKNVSTPVETDIHWGDRPSHTNSYVFDSSESEDENVTDRPVVTLKRSTVEAPNGVAGGTNTNQSVAAMLRERLKNSKLNLGSGASGVPSALSEANFASNIGVDRNVLALKNRYNGVAGNTSTSATAGAVQQSKKHQSKHSRPDIDAALDINTLKSREKAGGEDIDDVFRDNVLRMGERYQGTELGGRGAFGNGDKAGMDEEGEIDMRMFQRKESSQAEALQREANKVMKAQQQLRCAVESCRRCTESAQFARQSVISTGENTYLRMKLDPDALAEGHLEIVPISHVSSILQCDEETQKEIERFQSCLRRMYEIQGKGVLFLETAVHFHSRPHAHIDVIPIERGMEAETNMFFKEAFFSCDEEWAQHRKVIELSSAKPLQRAVPAHFQYLAAEWGDPTAATDSTGSGSTMAPYGGIVHPVESEHTIDTNFCLDVVAGLLELEPLRMRRGAGGKRTSHTGTAQGVGVSQAVSSFKQVWSTYDWTQYI